MIRAVVLKFANNLEVDNTQSWEFREADECWPTDSNDIEGAAGDGLRQRERLPDVVTSGACKYLWRSDERGMVVYVNGLQSQR